MVEDVDKLIKTYVYPILKKECDRLEIPIDFIKGVYGCYYRDFTVGIVEEVRENGNLVGVIIRIADCNNARGVLKTFFHEMFHVREMLYGKKAFSELRADIYAEKRILQLTLGLE